MIRTVKVWPQRAPNPPVKWVYFDPDPKLRIEDQAPDLKLTRILMAAVPPIERAPAYCTVIGEVYDGDPRQKSRLRIVLDEAVALDPADFNEEEQLKFEVHPKSMDYPTIDSLRRAVVALKDLWLPDLFILPPPEDQSFNRIIRATEGLAGYDRRQDAMFPYWFPFYRRDQPVYREGVVVDRTEPLVGFAVPEEEDATINYQIVENLLALDNLQVSSSCKLWHTLEHWREPMRRAMGLVLHWMQDTDMTYLMRSWTQPEVGYTDMIEAGRKESRLLQQQIDEEIAAIAWMDPAVFRDVEAFIEEEANPTVS